MMLNLSAKSIFRFNYLFILLVLIVYLNSSTISSVLPQQISNPTNQKFSFYHFLIKFILCSLQIPKIIQRNNNNIGQIQEFSIYNLTNINKNILIRLYSSIPQPMNFLQLQQHLSLAKYSSKFRKLTTFIDKTVLYKRQRWAIASLFSAIVTIRALNLEFLAILYISFLYLIYLIVLYFTPSGLPDPDEVLDESITFIQGDFNLKSIQSDRPVLRAITQFNLWKKICSICFITWFCTFFQIFKIPVYWPFLLIYFFWLVGLAIQRHCHHMKVYNYSLRDFDRKTGVEQETFE